MRQRGTAGPGSRAYAWLILALHPLIPLAWIAAAVLATMNLPGLGEGSGAALQDIVAEDSAALATQARSADLFGAPLASDVVVVLRNEKGLTPGELRSVADAARAVRAPGAGGSDALLAAVPLVNAPLGGVDWPETNTTAITYLGFDPALNLPTRERFARAYADRLRPADGTTVELAGATPARLSQFEAIEDALPLVTGASVLLVALIVGVHFRSVVAPLVTLAAAAVAYLVAIRLLGWTGERIGLSVPREVEPVLVVLLLGLVTDYSIFFLSGMRTALARGLPKREAMREATGGTAKIILTAGLIVAAGTGALVVGRLEFFRAFGPALAITALVSVAVCLTFIPAMMALLGRRLFGRLPPPPERIAGPETSEPLVARPSGHLPRRVRSRLAVIATALRMSRQEAQAEGRSPWRALAARVLASRPVALVVVSATVVLLLIAAAPAGRLDLGIGFASGLPPGDDVRNAAQTAAEAFAPGILAPTEVVIEQPGVGARREQLVALQEAIEREPGVAAVLGPREELPQFGTNATIAETGDAARLAVVLEEEPDSTVAIDRLSALEERLPELVGGAGLDDPRVSLAGETKLSAETVDAVVGDLLRIALAALAANLLLLAIFMRALVAPLYLLASSVLAFVASLGITVWALGQLGPYTGITYFVPLATAVLLVSLGSDYNVFVAGSIWDEARRRRLRDAVAVAAPRAAGAITVAGITLAATFALLALVPLRSFREFALLMVVGVLVDALVVRSVLIPGLVSLFGEASFWPGRRVRPPRHGALIDEVARRGDLDRRAAEELTEATLATLSQRISRGEARALAQQLPERLRAAMEGDHGDSFGVGEFVRRVATRAGTDEARARTGAIAVFGALREVVDEATLAYVRAQLSEDYSDLLAPTSPRPGQLRPVA